MIQVNENFKLQVVAALKDYRTNFDGTDGQFAKKLGINPSIYSRIKNTTDYDGIISPVQWINIGAELNVRLDQRKWNIVRTEPFVVIEEEILFCKAHSKAMMFADECEIGKTTTAKYLSRTLKNCFYIDASQCKTKILFARAIAQAIGLDSGGKIADLKKRIKYALLSLPKPIVIIDEYSDLERAAKLDYKEYWNATDGHCGWYLMGAESMIYEFEQGIANGKPGYAENFSRSGSNYSSAVPKNNKERRMEFYQTLLTDVLSANMTDKKELAKIVRQCLTPKAGLKIGGLRRAEAMLILNGEAYGA